MIANLKIPVLGSNEAKNARGGVQPWQSKSRETAEPGQYNVPFFFSSPSRIFPSRELLAADVRIRELLRFFFGCKCWFVVSGVEGKRE